MDDMGSVSITQPSMFVKGIDRFKSANIDEFLSEDYVEIDMGKLKDEERQFMVVDKDSGRVYDLRNENHVERLTESEINKSTTKASVNPNMDVYEIPEGQSVLIRPK